MSTHSVSKIKKLFRRFDEDLTGSIDKKALESILKALNMNLSSKEVSAIVKAVDKNADGMIQYDEFVDIIFFSSKRFRTQGTTGQSFPEDKARALWVFWQLLTSEDVPGSILQKDELLAAIRPDSEVMAKARELLEVEQDNSTAQAKVLVRLSSPDVKAHIELARETVTQEALIRAVWPRITDKDCDAVQRLMRKFLAQRGLSIICQALAKDEPVEFQLETLNFLFEEIDVDRDGSISIQELVKVGNLEKMEALSLSEKLDTGCEDGLISLKELQDLFTRRACNTVKESLKAVFATKATTSLGL